MASFTLSMKIFLGPRDTDRVLQMPLFQASAYWALQFFQRITYQPLIIVIVMTVIPLPL